MYSGFGFIGNDYQVKPQDIGEIPVWARNDNCVQDAVVRLADQLRQYGPEASAEPWQKERIQQYRRYLAEYIDGCRK